MYGKMTVLLRETAKALCAFLTNVFPQESLDWWQKSVIAALTFQQNRLVEQNRTRSLDGLDLAALLRVLDYNWHSVASPRNPTPGARNFVKEMFVVRNRWAHATNAGVTEDDVYRDLDTLQRFAAVIDAPAHIQEAIKETKAEILPQKRQTEEVPQTASAEFQVGQLVVLKSDPSQVGAIIAVIPGAPENRFTVFHNNTTATYYASQLGPKQDAPLTSGLLPISRFHAYLSALQISHPSVSTLYSLNAAKIDFVPYQYRPVLKFIRSDRPRLLIADSVGVGKTIEAGLILRELQARRDVKTVLIICPKPLIVERKWELEMKRFDERFTHLDGTTLRYCLEEMDLEGEWPQQHSKTIVPYSLFDDTLLHGNTSASGKRYKGLLDLDPPPRFDLVIVDEAHRIRNVDTLTHQGVRFFCDNAEAVVFLTATPIQLGGDDLFVLLNVLRSDLIIDRQSFAHMAAPNPMINRAIDLARSQQMGWERNARESLAQAASTPWGRSILQDNPDFQRLYDLFGQEQISAEERVEGINTLEQLHTFSRVLSRTRRRDIEQFTMRKPETINVDFTEEQRRLHDGILRVQAAILTQLHGNRGVAFMMTTIRRQAASCLFGLAPLLEDILTRRLDELVWNEDEISAEDAAAVPIEAIQTEIQHILDQAKALTSDDPKLVALFKIIGEKQQLPNNKVIVFSSFRHTLSYLFERLQAFGVRVGVVHGDIDDEERVSLRNRFRMYRASEDALDVLLFSEVGCEGLDYEFCDCLVNFDIPWNPMRIEQRIGRIDRRGQRSETVTIVNLITPGTIDADIYARCLMRIGVFNREIGASEEILGQITREIRNIAESITLTPNEQRAKLQQLADNSIRLVIEQQELEEKQLELFGLKIPELQAQRDVEEASSFWLSPEAIHNLVSHYLQDILGTDQEYILGERSPKTLRLSQEARERLVRDFRQLPRQKTASYRAWENWLKGGEQHLSITFDSQGARDNPETVLITPVHPLVRQSAMAYEPESCLQTVCEVADESIRPGDYPIAIYSWRLRGLHEDVELHGISSTEEVSNRLLALLEHARPVEGGPQSLPPSAVMDELESRHHGLWSVARDKHRDRIRQLAEFRRESLVTSHSARMSLLREQLERATNDKIRRMRQSQINTAEADCSRHMKQIDEALSQADIVSHLVARGVMRVVRKLPNAV